MSHKISEPQPPTKPQPRNGRLLRRLILSILLATALGVGVAVVYWLNPSPWITGLLLAILLISAVIAVYIPKMRAAHSTPNQHGITLLHLGATLIYSRVFAPIALSSLSASGLLTASPDGNSQVTFNLVAAQSTVEAVVLLIVATLMILSTRFLPTESPNSNGGNDKSTTEHVPLPSNSPTTGPSVTLNVNIGSNQTSKAFDSNNKSASSPTGDDLIGNANTRDPFELIPPLTTDELVHANTYQSYDSDRAPSTNYWVGRVPELGIMRDITEGVIAVTGIGGQGKSSIVAKAQDSWKEQNQQGFIDWRDCKEEGDRFEAKVASLIERITSGRLKGVSLERAQFSDIARLFFHLTRDCTGFIVFDNVDHYVNVNDRQFTGTLHTFISEALRCRSRLLIVITCRPSISYPDIRFREIPLIGLLLTETIDLFRLRNVPLSIQDNPHIKELHAFTKGHPFWLSMLAAELFRRPQSIAQIIEHLRQGRADDNRLIAMFRPIWKSLSDRERAILHTLSEDSRPNSLGGIKSLLGHKITNNQFDRAFRALMDLSLVVRKEHQSQATLYELHPLVRQYVRTELPRADRLPYINTIAEKLKVCIDELRKSGLSVLVISINTYERAADKIELDLEAENYEAAIADTLDVASAFHRRGLGHDFVRLILLVASKFDWNQHNLSELPQFNRFCELAIRSLYELDRISDAKDFIQRYEHHLPKNTSELINWYDTMCWCEWLAGNFSDAIRWGQQGVHAKKSSDLDTSADASHMLHLALRDNGKFPEALKYFTKDKELNSFLDDRYLKSPAEGTQYGNIGRTLQLMGDTQQAIPFLLRSAYVLENSNDDRTILCNRGYAALWIAQCARDIGAHKAASYFIARARDIWSKHLPLRMREIVAFLQTIPTDVSVPPPDNATTTELTCKQAVGHWLKEPNSDLLMQKIKSF